MPHSRLSSEEIDSRGQEPYDRTIIDQVETPENIGKQIVIDVETGDYDIDDDGLEASLRLMAKHPGAAHMVYGLATMRYTQLGAFCREHRADDWSGYIDMDQFI